MLISVCLRSILFFFVLTLLHFSSCARLFQCKPGARRNRLICQAAEITPQGELPASPDDLALRSRRNRSRMARRPQGRQMHRLFCDETQGGLQVRSNGRGMMLIPTEHDSQSRTRRRRRGMAESAVWMVTRLDLTAHRDAGRGNHAERHDRVGGRGSRGGSAAGPS